jgi:phosphosulfolactate synthase (CoM biosynthesis protein A)
MSTLAFLGVLALCIYFYQYRKAPQNKYQKTIDRYFKVMRNYGFKDFEIADMLHEIKNHEKLEETITKAEEGLRR